MSEHRRPSLRLERRLRAPVALVYAAWTKPEALLRWFGPGDTREVLSADVDLRVGGRFRVVMIAESGEVHRVGGVYREIVPNERLVFTWAWESTPERESLVTILLASAGSGTDLTLVHEQLFDVAARDGHARGWAGALDRLERSLA